MTSKQKCSNVTNCNGRRELQEDDTNECWSFDILVSALFNSRHLKHSCHLKSHKCKQ